MITMPFGPGPNCVVRGEARMMSISEPGSKYDEGEA